MPPPQIIPASAVAACPQRILLPAHYSELALDGRCNCDRLCGYIDAAGGPCAMPYERHPRDADGRPQHDLRGRSGAR